MILLYLMELPQLELPLLEQLGLSQKELPHLDEVKPPQLELRHLDEVEVPQLEQHQLEEVELPQLEGVEMPETKKEVVLVAEEVLLPSTSHQPDCPVPSPVPKAWARSKGCTIHSRP